MATNKRQCGKATSAVDGKVVHKKYKGAGTKDTSFYLLQFTMKGKYKNVKTKKQGRVKIKNNNNKKRNKTKSLPS